MKNKNKINKYYVGARHIAEAIYENHNDDWTSESLAEAIKKAKIQFDAENLDCAIVVKIVAVIRREKNPVTVKMV